MTTCGPPPGPWYYGSVFVRRVFTRSQGANRGISYRLVHSLRSGPGKSRQVVLAYFRAGLEDRVPKSHWRPLAAAIRDLLAGQPPLPLPASLSPSEEQLAQRVRTEAEAVTPLVRRRLASADFNLGFRIVDDPDPDPPSEQPVSVLPSSLRHTDVRAVGAARLLCKQARRLGLRECLAACGLRPRYVRLGLAQILARALHPASERETLRWLQHDSALPELLGLQPSDLAKDALHAAADALWDHRADIEAGLFDRERKLFAIEPRIVFYDLTNTFHAGRPRHALAARGRSKQKRHDAPLVTLGLLLDGEGFPRRSEVLKGNVGEATTLQAAIKSLQLGADERPTIVFDAGIESQANLDWLREQGLHWICVDRSRHEPPQREPDSRSRSADGQELKLWRLPAPGAAKSAEADGSAPAAEAKEVRLCVWSPRRERDEREMLRRQRERYEAELQSLHEGLSTPRRLKNYEKVLRKVGRLERQYKLVASQYTVRVEQERKRDRKGKWRKGSKATAVRWERNRRFEQRERQRGTSLLRTSRVEWDDARIVREYYRLTEIEATFRALKQELGLRPMYHQLRRRVSGHLFVTVLAYHVVHALRRRLGNHGIRYCWGSIRNRMATWVRLTTTMRTAGGKVWSQRQDVDPNNEQARIAAAAGVPFRRHRRQQEVILSKVGDSAGDKER